MEVWDVRKLDIDEFISMPSLNKTPISKEYILPNFLSQCAFANINGILYGSVKNRRGFNLVLFNYKIGESIVLYRVREGLKRADMQNFKRLGKK